MNRLLGDLVRSRAPEAYEKALLKNKGRTEEKASSSSSSGCVKEEKEEHLWTLFVDYVGHINNRSILPIKVLP